jgi:hypothetical protein
MKLTLDAEERAILRASLGVADDASDTEIASVIRERLTAPAATAGTLNVVERDATIAAAVRDGKFSADRAQHWTAKWDRDPVATRREIGRLQPGASLGLTRTASRSTRMQTSSEVQASQPSGL